MQDQKLENLLNLALDAAPAEREKSLNLNVGFDEETDTWDVIVKYSGELTPVEAETVQVVRLLNEYAIITLTEQQLERLAQFPQIEFVEKPKRLFFALNRGRAASCVDQVRNLGLNLTGRGVLVAVVDSGVDYTHPDFRNEDGTTRIVSIWDQTIPADGMLVEADGMVFRNLPPNGYRVGTEYSRERINAALAADSLEEQQRFVPSRDLSGHGTGVLGIAAGNGRASAGRYRGVAPDSDILVVRLGTPRQGAAGFPRTTELMQGIDYAVRRALELRLPLALNLSFGNTYGAHDGSTLLARYLDDVSNLWKSVISVGTGNEADKAGHTAGDVREGEVTEIPFTIGAYEPALNMQLWKNYADVYDVAIIHPSGQSTGELRRGLGTQRFRLGQTELLIYYGEPSLSSKAQEIYIDFLPVADYLDAGIWRIQLLPKRIVQGNYDLWMPSAAALGADTGFLFPMPETTLTIPSTAERVISVSAYNAATDAYAEFSGRGYTRELQGIKPDLAAPGVDVTTTAVGGGYRSVTGTSFASPFVAGAAALLMQWGIVDGNDPYMYGEKVKAQLIFGARKLRGEAEYPNSRVGWGALCVENSIP